MGGNHYGMQKLRGADERTAGNTVVHFLVVRPVQASTGRVQATACGGVQFVALTRSAGARKPSWSCGCQASIAGFAIIAAEHFASTGGRMCPQHPNESPLDCQPCWEGTFAIRLAKYKERFCPLCWEKITNGKAISPCDDC